MANQTKSRASQLKIRIQLEPAVSLNDRSQPYFRLDGATLSKAEVEELERRNPNVRFVFPY